MQKKCFIYGKTISFNNFQSTLQYDPQKQICQNKVIRFFKTNVTCITLDNKKKGN